MYSVQALLGVVVAVLVSTSHQSMALRGDVKLHRTLQLADNVPGETDGPPPPKGPKEDKAAGDKAAKEPKKSKKEACKKAKKKDKDKKEDKENKKARDRRRRTQADKKSPPTPPDDHHHDDEMIFEGNVEELGYCSQGEFSVAECSNLEGIASDGTIKGALRLEIVHSHEKDPETIASEAEEILDNGDTALRFVGCKDMFAAPPPKKAKSPPKKAAPGGEDAPPGARRRRRHRRRKLHGDHDDDHDHEIDYIDETEKIDVTGVDFNNLNVKKNGKLLSTTVSCVYIHWFIFIMFDSLTHHYSLYVLGCINTDVPSGYSCDVIESNVDIFYRSAATPDDDDKEDMNNLLIETILNQAHAGAFGDLGSVESVEVDTRGGISGSGGSSTIFAAVFGVVGALLIGLCIYCCCCRGGKGRDVQSGKNDDTSDEEPDGGWSSDDNAPAQAHAVPMAHVVAIEEPTSRASAPPAEIKKKEEQQGAGGFFEWITGSEAEEQKKKEQSKKKTDESSVADEAGCTEGFGMW